MVRHAGRLRHAPVSRRRPSGAGIRDAGQSTHRSEGWGGCRRARAALVGALSASAVTAAAIAAQDPVIVTIQTELGSIVAELYPAAAPVTVENFLAYVDRGVFDGGSFFRTVHEGNQPDQAVRIVVVQGGPDRSRRGELDDPIPLERTSLTGLTHLDGTLSMARAGPDAGRAQFFISVGDQPELDYGGARNPDGQGFAAFGRVVSGMDVVRRIQRSSADGQRLVPVIRILQVRRPSA